jgi:hypothetical protein
MALGLPRAPRKGARGPAVAGRQPATAAQGVQDALPENRIERRLSEPSLPEKILAIHGRLQESKTPHAFGGALALAYYAEPRATIDVDLNVFLAPSSYEAVRAGLAALSVGGGPERRAVERDGQCRLWWGRTPIDLFFAYDALHEAMRTALRREPFAEASIPVLSPEHLIVCKAVFNRPKDWLDIEQVVVGVPELDVAEIQSWLIRILGEADTRVGRFDTLLDAEL